MENLNKENFAMWCSSNEETSFSKSETRKILRALFEELNGIESYMFYNLGKMYDFIKSNEVPRLKLPEEMFVYKLDVEERGSFLICASKEKGISFRFNTKTTSPDFRKKTLSLFLNAARSLKKEITKNNLPFDKYENNESPLNWYLAVEERMNQNEKEGKESEIVGFWEI